MNKPSNKELEEIVEEFERKLTNEDWSNMNVADVGKHSKRHSEWLHKALNQAKEQGVKDYIENLNHEQQKFLDGFGHPEDCDICRGTGS